MGMGQPMMNKGTILMTTVTAIKVKSKSVRACVCLCVRGQVGVCVFVW